MRKRAVHMSKVFVLTGMPGAGKEEFVKVAQQDGYSVIRMGDVVRLEAEKRKVAMDDRGVGGFASSERQAHGPGSGPNVVSLFLGKEMSSSMAPGAWRRSSFSDLPLARALDWWPSTLPQSADSTGCGAGAVTTPPTPGKSSRKGTNASWAGA